MRGQEAISERIVQLIGEATSRIVFGVQDDLLFTPDIMEALRNRSEADVDVLLLTPSEAVYNQSSEDDAITVIQPRKRMSERDHTGRMLLIDQSIVLHSVLGDEELPGLQRETAYWSSGSGFASTLNAMMERFIDEVASE